MGVADIPATADARRHVLGGAQLELHAVLDLEGVGVVGGVGGGVIEVAVLAEEAFEAAALLAEVGGVEGVALVQVGAAPAGSDEAVGHGREADIGDGVEAVDGAGVHRVGQAGLAGVLGREDVVGHAAAEETVVAERVGGHLDAHFGVDGRDVDRRRGEVAEEPAAELAPAVGECGVEPESRLYGPAQARRAEERSVGGIAQHGVDFGLVTRASSARLSRAASLSALRSESEVAGAMRPDVRALLTRRSTARAASAIDVMTPAVSFFPFFRASWSA